MDTLFQSFIYIYRPMLHACDIPTNGNTASQTGRPPFRETLLPYKQNTKNQMPNTNNEYR